MSDSGSFVQVAPSSALSRVAAIVGVGHTDYGDDYRLARHPEPGEEAPHSDTLVIRAFERALDDCGLTRDEIDGLRVSFMYQPTGLDEVANTVGVSPRYLQQGSGIFVGEVPAAVEALHRGECDTIALVYAAVSRSSGREFGGSSYFGGPSSYYYHHPWGWSSQAAHWAFRCRYYFETYGATERDLASVCLTLRDAATLNESAIMRQPLTIEDYLSVRHIVRPLRLYDLCLVNDGAVCVILRRLDGARELPRPPVVVAGWGDSYVQHSKMSVLVEQGLQPLLADAGRQALEMAELSLGDISHFQGYDASSIHLISQLEGYGFVPMGEGLRFSLDGEMGIGGSLPVNTSGGMLSEAYMHGWNHLVEATRQLRHEAGRRQVPGVETSMLSVATTESAHPVIFTRES